MYRINGTIEGIADLLFNAPPPVEEEEQDRKTKKHPSKMTVAENRADSMKRLHQNGHGIHLPPGGFEKALLDGANLAGLKDGKRSLSTLLKATVFLEEDPTLGCEKPDYIHEKQGRVPPRTGAMVVIRRPAMNTGWTATFSLVVTTDRIVESDVRLALETAGMLVGLGGWRPRYGRFKITEWERVNA